MNAHFIIPTKGVGNPQICRYSPQISGYLISFASRANFLVFGGTQKFQPKKFDNFSGFGGCSKADLGVTWVLWRGHFGGHFDRFYPLLQPSKPEKLSKFFGRNFWVPPNTKKFARDAKDIKYPEIWGLYRQICGFPTPLVGIIKCAFISN